MLTNLLETHNNNSIVIFFYPYGNIEQKSNTNIEGKKVQG